VGADDHYRLCPDCFRSLKPLEGLLCQRCGLPLPDGGAHCYDCRKNPSAAFDRIRSAGSYGGLLKGLILQFKYQHKDFIVRPLARLLLDALDRAPFPVPVNLVAPVPLHWFKRFRRGYNQAELLAAAVAAHLDKPHLPCLLRRTRYTTAQSRLDRRARRANLAGCFSVRDHAATKGKSVLLIDDVCTTTATIHACAQALKSAGAKTVYGLTVARD
jgi:ComF family protein